LSYRLHSKLFGIYACALVAIPACKETTTTAAPAPVVVASAPAPVVPPVPSVVAATPASAANASGKMAHCPSTVDGAKTEIKTTQTGVEIAVTGKDVAEIRARSKFLAQTAKDSTPEVQHNGSGEGGGSFGRCPVVLRRTNVESVDIEGGAKIAVSAKDPKELDWLRRETQERYAELGKAGASDAGQKHMANCPSAVKGAKTAIKDAKDAVEVTVTAGDATGTNDIRERSKRLVESSKVDSKVVAHTGGGSGGGELGRCPVVLLETTVSAKDVPGGSLLTVKPSKADHLAKLKKEMVERSAAF
jgi:TusA-related sulfurtransferase